MAAPFTMSQERSNQRRLDENWFLLSVNPFDNTKNESKRQANSSESECNMKNQVRDCWQAHSLLSFVQPDCRLITTFLSFLVMSPLRQQNEANNVTFRSQADLCTCSPATSTFEKGVMCLPARDNQNISTTRTLTPQCKHMIQQNQNSQMTN